VSGSDDTTINLWDVQTGGVVKTFCGHTSWVCSVSISAGNTTIASGSDDETIRLWDIKTGGCSRIIEQHGRVSSIVFSPVDPQHFISVSGKEVQQWDISGHQINSTYKGSCVVFSSDGSQFITCHRTNVVVRNTGSGVIVTEFQTADDDFRSCCCFSPDGKLVAVAVEYTIYIWDITSSDPHPIETFVEHTPMNSLVFSSPSSLISSSHEKTVKFWQIGTKQIDPAMAHPQSTSLALSQIKSLALQAKDSAIVSCDLGGVVRIWDVPTGLCKASFKTPAKDPSWSDVRLIDGRLILIWYADEKIHIWDVEKERSLQTVDGILEDIQDIRISGDGTKVFCLHDQCIRAWSVWTGEVVGKIGVEEPSSPVSLIVDGSRVWAYCLISGLQGWDFGAPGSSPIQLVSTPSLHISDTRAWDVGLSQILDTATGKVVFQLGGRFLKPVDVRLDGWYLLARYQSGEVLILDFNHVSLG